jgi:hypothetical protein
MAQKNPVANRGLFVAKKAAFWRILLHPDALRCMPAFSLNALIFSV